RSLGEAEILASFLAQFYDDKPLPKLILLSHALEEQALLAEAFCTRAGHRIEILAPQRGEKRMLIDHALKNAREALGRRMAESQSQRKLLQGLSLAFALDAPPRRIEVFDNSHIQGSEPVGAMIVAGSEGFIKSQYRKFNMRSPAGAEGDDFGMMREMLTRRYTRLLKEEAEGAPRGDEIPLRPDLILIDGGQGQVSSALAVLADLGIHGLPLIGIAKGEDRDAGREHFYIPGKPPFMLDSKDPVLYYVQRLRDEAHRFAIGGHRARRSKAIGINPLDEIPGIGGRRKKALLLAFGSAKAVARASVADLEKVEGVSRQLAQTIYDFFHEGGK
ncbi:MAG TPA: excinuclease ABC subunit UvrC, partial [Aestuariivirgaceae bacterium]